jgi:hypothetical protein
VTRLRKTQSEIGEICSKWPATGQGLPTPPPLRYHAAKTKVRRVRAHPLLAALNIRARSRSLASGQFPCLLHRPLHARSLSAPFLATCDGAIAPRIKRSIALAPLTLPDTGHMDDALQDQRLHAHRLPFFGRPHLEIALLDRP